MRLLLGTFLFAIASALVPVLNVEVYLAAVGSRLQDITAWQLALVGAVGQMVGKLAWYFAGEWFLKLRWVRKKMSSQKWQDTFARWQQRIQGRPVYAGGVCLVTAYTGIPPFAIIAVLAGSLRMNLAVFFLTGLAGRFLRFWTVLAGAEALFGLF